MKNSPDKIISAFLNLKNETMMVNKVEFNIFDFKSHIDSKGLTGNIGISFSGRALIDTENKVVIYWDMIKKTSSGMGGENMGLHYEKYSISGKERSGTGGGAVLGGDQYHYDYAKVRDQVRSIVESNGWKFKTVLIKPKW